MPSFPNDYVRLVLDDIATYKDLAKPVKAGLLERALVRKADPSRLHPNPDDEFSQPAFGPNFSIVSKYDEELRYVQKKGLSMESYRLSVEKISTGGYMLLDGHHRWLAAHRVGNLKMPIEIMNVTPVEDILSMMEKSDRTMSVSFDLDEVLLTDGIVHPADKRISPIMKRILKMQLRKNTPDLIRKLQELGFDVWVYTGEYRSEWSLNKLFKLHKTRVDGIVNGFRSSETRKAIGNAFSGKYRYTLHIDNKGVVCVDSQTKQFETIDIAHSGDSWASEALAAVKKLPCLATKG